MSISRSVSIRAQYRISVHKYLEGVQNTTPWEPSIRPLIIWVYRNSVQKYAQKRLCNFWSVWPSKNCLCNFSRCEKLHNEHKSFREECFGIARKHCATGVLFRRNPVKLGVGSDLPKIRILNQKMCSKGLKNHFLIDTDREIDTDRHQENTRGSLGFE